MPAVGSGVKLAGVRRFEVQMRAEVIFEGVFAMGLGLLFITQRRKAAHDTFEAAGRALTEEFYERAFLLFGIASVIVGLVRLLGVPFHGNPQ